MMPFLGWRVTTPKIGTYVGLSVYNSSCYWGAARPVIMIIIVVVVEGEGSEDDGRVKECGEKQLSGRVITGCCSRFGDEHSVPEA